MIFPKPRPTPSLLHSPSTFTFSCSFSETLNYLPSDYVLLWGFSIDLFWSVEAQRCNEGLLRVRQHILGRAKTALAVKENKVKINSTCKGVKTALRRFDKDVRWVRLFLRDTSFNLIGRSGRKKNNRCCLVLLESLRFWLDIKLSWDKVALRSVFNGS